MARFVELADGFAPLLGIAIVCRAIGKLLQNPERKHRELVPTWERRATTVVGAPPLLIGLSTMAGGPLAVPNYPFSLTPLGAVLAVYPDFTPTSTR